MSLALTLSNALSGLHVNQSALQVTANNVANVNTPGYSRKQVEVSARVLAGQGAGAEITAITRAVNQFLVRDLRAETSTLGERQVRSEYYTQMQELFGNLASDTSIGATIDDLATAMEGLATDPESAANRIAVVNAGTATARSLNELADQIQTMREQADREISAAIDDINAQLEIIADLNAKISGNLASGTGTADLQDQRHQALNKITEYMSVQYFERSNGQLVVLSKNGQTLVETQAARLGYTSATAMTAEQRYVPPGSPGYPGGISGIILNPTASDDPATVGARDLTGVLGNGKLSALIEMRDRTLVDLNSQFDELSARLRDEINAVHNRGIGYPGSTVMEGGTVLPLGDATSFAQGEISGSFRLGTADADGAVTAIQFNFPGAGPAGPGEVDITATGPGAPPRVTVQDIVDAINTSGLDVSASVVDGKLRIASTSPAGDTVVLDDSLGSSVSVGGTSRGFSHFFGLNDFFASGQQYGGYASGVVDNSVRSTGSGTLTIQTTTGSFTVNYNSGQRLDQVARSINDALAGQGVRAEVQKVTGGSRLVLTSDAGDFLVADSGSLLSNLNVRPGIDGAAAELAIRPDIIESPDRLARGTLQGNATDGFHIGVSDDTTARALADAFNQKFSFGGVGGLPAEETTLSGFGMSILSFNAANAATAATELEYQDSLHRTLQDKALSFSGVNMDEELSNMVIYQNAYQGSARLVQAVNEMFEILVNLG
ncbi:MAG TPA: flagellar hook-associated protein FlgK [Alphaproteobacteria bacterium]|nr:flagellar hook-associated protein FlgK [Alphaproteobacteria bacterium]